MAGLINLISQNSSKLTILPILVVIIGILTIVISHFFNKKKVYKYLPSLVIGLIALAIGIYSITLFTDIKGLNSAWIAVFLATSAICGILICFIIDLINGIKKSYKDLEKENK